MAYFNGQASSFADLLNSLVNACVSLGWTWADSILNKGDAYIQLYSTETNTAAQGSGITAIGGTGKSGVVLVNPSNKQPRIGRIGDGALSSPINFPCDYNIHISNDEVFLIVKSNVDYYFYLGFGYSGESGSGLWIAATTTKEYYDNTYSGGNGFQMYLGGGGSATYRSVGSGFMWRDSFRADYNNNNVMFFNGAWIQGGNYNGSGPEKGFNASIYISNLIGRMPSNWSSETLLIPINCYYQVASYKVQLVLSVKTARYLRIDNHNPEEIIQIGTDRWKVYPFYRKNISQRDGSQASVNHSGTFGLAVKYDGP